MNDSLIASAHAKTMEDPAEHAFTTDVSFMGREFTVFQGIAANPSDSLRLLLKSACFSANSVTTDYATEIGLIAWAILRISNRIARHAAIPAHLRPKARDRSSTLTIPNSHYFANLKSAVSFSPKQLLRTIRPVPFPAIREMIVTPPIAPTDLEVSLDADYHAIAPLIGIDNTIIVVNPPALIAALRHYTVVEAKRQELQHQLQEQFDAQVTRDIRIHLLRMRWKPLSWPTLPTVPWASESIWSLDTDKVAHLIILTDKFDGYTASDPYGRSKDPIDVSGDIDTRIQDVSKAIRSTYSSGTDVLHLFVLQDFGPQCGIQFGLSSNLLSNDRKSNLILLIPQSDLGVISRLSKGDPLELWKFADLYNRMKRDRHIQAWYALDVYGFYRDNGHSFYVNDKNRIDDANGIWLNTDLGSPLRIDDTITHTYRSLAPIGDQRSIALERYPGTHDDSLYAVHPIEERNTGFMLTVRKVRIWIDYSDSTNSLSAQEREGRLSICHGVAYWLREVTPSITGLIDNLKSKCTEIKILISSRADLGSVERFRSESEPRAWLTTRCPAIGTVHLILHPAHPRALSGPTNSGERHILERLLNCLAKMSKPTDQHTGNDISRIVDLHAPLGPKKMIMYLDQNRNPRLIPGDLPSARVLRDHDLHIVVDTIADKLTFPPADSKGFIEKGDRCAVLNNIVGIHFQDLQDCISQLDSRDLLSFVVRQHEAIVYKLADEALTLPARLACFGSEDRYTTEIYGHIDKLVEADASARFLIEYIAAQPPTGQQPISLSTYDYLMALSHEIIGKGFLSDAVKYNSADIQLRKLATRRLGVKSSGRYLTGVQEFRSVRSSYDTKSYQQYFAYHWEHPNQIIDSDSIDNLDIAVQAEFGFTMTNLKSLIDFMTDLSISNSIDPAVFDRSHVIHRAVDELNLREEIVDRILKEISLRPRRSFFPNDRSGVYPWRFNRDLSYLRRPVVLSLSDASERLIWGIRHLNRSGSVFLQNITSGRLKAQTPAMQKFISQIRSEQTKAFNERVAEAFRTFPGVETITNIDHFGTCRIELSRAHPLGDIDVLAINRSRKHIVAVESKDFGQARNPLEVHNEVKKLFGDKSSALSNHRRRVDWLTENSRHVLSSLGIIDRSERWRIDGMIVVSAPLFTPHVTASPIRVLVLGDIVDALPKWRRR